MVEYEESKNKVAAGRSLFDGSESIITENIGKTDLHYHNGTIHDVDILYLRSADGGGGGDKRQIRGC